MRNISFIILGPQGSGKGTQSQLLAEKLNLNLLSMGAVTRKLRDEDSDLGRKAKEYYDQGMLFPDDITKQLLENTVKKLDANKGIIFEGVPRSYKQLYIFDGILKEFNISEPWFIYLKIKKSTIMDRIGSRKVCDKCNTPYLADNKEYKNGICEKCGGKLVTRPDDQPAAIEKRLESYHALTEPLIDYYKKKNKLIEIDGEPKIPEVFKKIIKSLKEKGVISDKD